MGNNLTDKENKTVKWVKNIRDDAIATLDHIAKEEPNVSPLLYNGRKEKAQIILDAFDELEKYREMQKKLESVYGKNDDLLETIVNSLVNYEHLCLSFPNPLIKSRLLMDDSVDEWDAYREIGTVDECRAAVEKQRNANSDLSIDS